MSYRSKDIIGQRFGRLVVIERMPRADNGNAMFKAKCDCGAVVVKRGSHLRLGAIVSCGCYNIERSRLNLGGQTHGFSGTPTHASWKAMHQRCNYKKHPAYHRYGGRGITVCERWNSFENFLSDMGERPKGKNLERRNNNKGYFKDNCKWATPKEQGRNRYNNHTLTFNGRTACISEWAEITGLRKTTIRERLLRGLSDREALCPL